MGLNPRLGKWKLCAHLAWHDLGLHHSGALQCQCLSDTRSRKMMHQPEPDTALESRKTGDTYSCAFYMTWHVYHA